MLLVVSLVVFMFVGTIVLLANQVVSVVVSLLIEIVVAEVPADVLA